MGVGVGGGGGLLRVVSVFGGGAGGAVWLGIGWVCFCTACMGPRDVLRRCGEGVYEVSHEGV